MKATDLSPEARRHVVHVLGKIVDALHQDGRAHTPEEGSASMHEAADYLSEIRKEVQRR